MNTPTEASSLKLQELTAIDDMLRDLRNTLNGICQHLDNTDPAIPDIGRICALLTLASCSVADAAHHAGLNA